MQFGSLFRSGGETHDFRRLYAPERFREAMDRERARSDRWGQPLALLSLGVADRRTGRRTLLQIARILGRRLRLTDEAGWIDRRHIGILMPNTAGWGRLDAGGRDLLGVARFSAVAAMQGVLLSVRLVPACRRAAGRRRRRARRGGSDRGYGAVVLSRPAAVEAGRRHYRLQPILGGSCPLLLVLAGLVRLTSPGPVLFCQTRMGLGGRRFTLYKFRTMVAGAERLKEQLRDCNEQEGPVFEIQSNPRITPFGRFLRKFSLDEFPQMWNVLKGDMSLVGPRPPLPEEVAKYAVWQHRRLDVTPGLTCLWQVRGRSKISFTQWMRMDMQYIARCSPWCDARLLVETVPALVTGRGAC